MLSRTRTPTPLTSSTTVAAATPTGTAGLAARFAARFTDDYYRPLPSRGARGTPALRVGSIGAGSYLGECTDEEDARYEATLYAGFVAGCNLVDTAIHHRCQRSERTAGRALAHALSAGVVRRDEVVVCTRGGFVALDGAPPATRADYEAFLDRELFAPGIVAPSELTHGGHSLAPRFLRHQLARSRANLGVDTIDVYYLHEPERQLDTLDATSFAATLRRAVETLEECVARGEIARWGIATWRGLRVPPGAKGHLALGDVVAAAHDVAGDAHHFAAVQLPISLAMPEAVRASTQPLESRGAARVVPALHAAQAHGLAVIASAPLMQGQLAANLPPQVRDAFPGCETDAQRAITFARALPGVTATIVGMRSTEHLAENLRAAR